MSAGEEVPYLGFRGGDCEEEWGAPISSASAGEEGRTMTRGPLALALRFGEALVLRLWAFRRGVCCSVKLWAVGDHEEGDVELWRLDGVMVELDWNVDMDGEC